MKSGRAAIGFGLFAVVAIVLTYTMYSTLQRSVTGATQSYSAIFTDVLGLRAGDDIRMAGVRVGRVDTIDFGDNYQAKVGFRIQSDQHPTTTTKAVVRYQNLIGQRYIALLPGQDPGVPLPPGGQIPIQRTEPSFDVSALLSGFEPLFSVLRPDQVNSLSKTLIQALQGNDVSMSELITQAAQLATTFGQRDRILGDVVTNLSSVITGLAHRSGDLETLITQTRSLMEGLYKQGAALESSVDRVAKSTDALAGLITAVKPGVAAAQDKATSGIALLLTNGASLDKAAVELPNFLNRVAQFSGNGAYGNAYLCTLDVSLWGVLLPPGLFSQIGGNSHSEVCR
jgi:phospholipid/cholesterol/gamma-HCH transport system substrate-binding protein